MATLKMRYAEDLKIGIIEEPLIWWTGMTSEDRHEWGHVGMVVIISDLITKDHYNIKDPDGVLNPMFASKKLIQEIRIEWRNIR